MALFTNFPSWISPFVIPGLPIRWYSIMYVVAFAITYVLFRYQAKKGQTDLSSDDTMEMFLWCIGGLFIGARLFSVIFYDNSGYYLTKPWLIFWPFANGKFVGLPGMSYHGGLVGAVVGMLIFTKRHKRNFFVDADTLVAGIPLGYTFGRLGNFINGELWGRVTTRPWGMIFPDAPRFSTSYEWVRNIATEVGMDYSSQYSLNLPRHPSQLYEAFFEGIVLWLIIWFVFRPRRDKHAPGFLLGIYLIGYGLVRFVIEYFREPDSSLGFIFAWGEQTEPTALFLSPLNISMGQILCFCMILGGIALLVIQHIRYKKKNLQPM